MAAVVPCVGPRRQPGWFFFGVRLGALAIGEAQLTGRSRALLPAGRRPYRNQMSLDPRKTRIHNIWCRPKVRPLDVVVKFSRGIGCRAPALNTGLVSPIFRPHFRFDTRCGVAERP